MPDATYTSTDIFHSYDNEFVNSAVNAVATQASAYYDAISESVDVAIDGFRFAEEAMNIYTRITSGNDTVAHATILLSDLLELANQGHARSLAISEGFRMIRSELLQVRTFESSNSPVNNTPLFRSPEIHTTKGLISRLISLKTSNNSSALSALW